MANIRTKFKGSILKHNHPDDSTMSIRRVSFVLPTAINP
jgi:hypothetical protein